MQRPLVDLRGYASRLDALMPAGQTTPEQRLRGRLFVGLVGVSVLMVILLSASQLIFGSHVLAAIISAAGFGALAVLVLARLGRSVALGAHGLAAIWCIAVCSAMVVRGGLGRPVALAIMIPPLLALLVGGRRLGMVWLVVALTAFTLIAVAQQLTGPWVAVELTDPVILNYSGTAIFTIGIFGIVVVYEKLRERTQRDLATQQAALLRAEQERLAAQAEARLMQARRLGQLGTLAAGMAHEINNPLNNIYGHLALLLEDGLPPEAEVRPILERMKASAERIRKIVADAGDLARAPLSEDLSVDVHAVLEESLTFLRNELLPVEIERAYGELPPVRADATRLGQVFVNVVANAAEAMRGRTAKPKIHLSSGVSETPTGKVAWVEVRDNGPGFSAEARRRAFEPFFTTKREGQGTGLGLWVVASILEKLGGHAEILPHRDGEEGARLRLHLPVDAAAPTP